ASPDGLTTTCNGSFVDTPATAISLSGASLAANTSCTFWVKVTGTAAGDQANTTGPITATETGAGVASNTATLTVVAPPKITKTFAAPSVPLGGTTTLSFTISNPAANTVALTGIGLTDTFPTGLAIATPNGLTGTCGTGTITANAGDTSVTLTGGNLAVNTSCTFSVNVVASAAGALTNTTDAITSTEGGSGATASANLAVLLPPVLTKAFGATRIPVNGTTTLSFPITNPASNTMCLTGVAFSDAMPSGIVVASPNGLTGSCGTISASGGTVSMSGASLGVGASCTFSVNVKGTSGGDFTNTTGAVTSTNAGTGNTASANISVTVPPTVTKAFGATSIPLNGTTTLTFTINNLNTSALTGIGFTDTLPAGLQVASPDGLTTTCNGSFVDTPATAISLSGASLAANTSCTFSVKVTGTAAGNQANTTGPITATETGAGIPSNTATLTVVAPPTLT